MSEDEIEEFAPGELDPVTIEDWKLARVKLDRDDPEYYSQYHAPLQVPHKSYRKMEKYEAKLRDDIAFFADFYFDMFMEPKQVEFANSCMTNPHTVACFSRQSGKSTTLAVLNVHQLFYGRNIFIESYAPTEKQALKVIFARTRQLFESQEILYDGIKKIMRSGWIEMYNGNCFQAQTANKDSNIRGFSPSVIELDESQSIPDEKYHADIKGSGVAMKGLTSSVRREINKLPMSERQAAIDAVVTRTKIWEAGTPLGRNHYYENVEIPDMECYVVKQKWNECSFIDEQMIMREMKRMPSATFRQEFECEFNIEEGFAFDWYDLTAAMDENVERKFPRHPHGIYVAGVDLGQRVDHTALTILEVLGPTRRMVFHHVFDLRRKWVDMATQINEFFNIWQPGLVLVDCTGQMNRYFQQYFLSMPHPIVGYTYNQDTKAELVKLCQVKLEKGDLELWDDDSLKREFKKFEEKRLPRTGRFQYDAGEGEHDDQVNSVMLALMAAEKYAGDGTFAGTVFVPHKMPKPSANLAEVIGGSGPADPLVITDFGDERRRPRHRAQEGAWDGRKGYGEAAGPYVGF